MPKESTGAFLPSLVGCGVACEQVNLRRGGQRVATVLMYLEAAAEGARRTSLR